MMTFRQPFAGEWPVTQRYGEKYTSAFHTGIDYGCPKGTEILASADGVVVFAGYDKTGYGIFVIIQHATDCSTLYGHLQDSYVKREQVVQQGELIGHSGNTGNSTGPHLHFEARKQWNIAASHFDPVSLPLICMDDISVGQSSGGLIGVDGLKPGLVEIVCPAGAFVHNGSFSEKNVFPCGSKFVYTGESIRQNRLDFCKCEVWIAVNDGETQILKNC